MEVFHSSLCRYSSQQSDISIQVVSARSALLSNYEVLTLLKELESDQLARQKTALRIKKEEEERVALEGKDAAPSQASLLIPEEVSENLRTVEFEVRLLFTALSSVLLTLVETMTTFVGNSIPLR